MEIAAPWEISIDTGGTFTDCVATCSDGQHRVVKVLSSGVLRGLATEQIDAERIRIQATWMKDARLVGYTLAILKHEWTAEVVAHDQENGYVTLASPWPKDHSLPLPIELGAGEPAPVLANRDLLVLW